MADLETVHDTFDHTGLTGVGGSSGLSTVVITSDVTSTSTSNADATGLSFAVTNGQRYMFDFYIYYTTAASTTGIVLSLNGPTVTYSPFLVRAHSGATTAVLTARPTFDTNATTTDSTSSTLLAIISGLVLPTADGTLIVRFATEVGGSQVAIKAGSAGRLYTL